MALPGELDVEKVCSECGRETPVKVCISGAGYYIGQVCDYCGTISRLSYDYYPTQEAAQTLLDNDTWKRRDTDYHPAPLTIIKLRGKKKIG